MRKLPKRQAAVLECLRDFRGWPSPGPSGGGWRYASDTATRQICDALVRKGLAVKLSPPVKAGPWLTEYRAT